MRRLSLAAVAALVFAAAGHADDVVVPLTVRPGPLSLVPATALAHGARIGVAVTDARGHGAGWTLLARMAGPGAPTVVVTGVDGHCGFHSTCTLPRTRVRYPITLSSLRSVAIFDAQRGTGMGAVELTVRLGVQSRQGAAFRFAVQPS